MAPEARSLEPTTFPPLDEHPMSKLDPSETLQQLDRRHDQLIQELSELNSRLEDTLRSISESNQPTESDELDEAASTESISQ